jgi:hypothetical protein
MMLSHIRPLEAFPDVPENRAEFFSDLGRVGAIAVLGTAIAVLQR